MTRKQNAITVHHNNSSRGRTCYSISRVVLLFAEELDSSSSSPLTRVRAAAFDELLLLLLFTLKVYVRIFYQAGVTTEDGAVKRRHGDTHKLTHARKRGTQKWSFEHSVKGRATANDSRRGRLVIVVTTCATTEQKRSVHGLRINVTVPPTDGLARAHVQTRRVYCTAAVGRNAAILAALITRLRPSDETFVITYQ